MKTLLLVTSLLLFVNAQNTIIRFNGYFDESKRLEILNEAFPFHSFYLSGQRQTKYSDFELINDNSFKHISHSLIRDIHTCNSTNLHLNANVPFARRRPALDIPNVALKIQADRLWANGYTGKGIKIAIFDTGLTSKRMHFRNVVVERDYTNENSLNDRVGHGTFVAGIISGINRRCPGIAPDAQLYIYKVFEGNQESQTAWFLDAFNDAIQHQVDIINLSIGGSDYNDKLFMDKVNEVIDRGITFVSAVGNDGPTFGSINNPADHPAVIGVGAINSAHKLAVFSSRGPTTLEFPEGYGRIKPDIVTYGVQLRASALNGGCKFMSGTSVAAPLLTGSIALLLSSIPKEERNSMRIHQVLKLGAEPFNNTSMYEHRAGRLNLLNSFVALREYKPKLTLFPPNFDMTNCPHNQCPQPLYANSLPLIVNLTAHNGHNSSVSIKQIQFEYSNNRSNHLLEISVEHNAQIDQYGYLAVFVQVNKLAFDFNGQIEGQLRIECELKNQHRLKVLFPIRVLVVSTPPKSRRILWDQYRNLYYPVGFLPRDDLRSKSPLDSNIDHPHTNFQQLYNTLRSNGYFIETSGRPLTCLDLSNYGHLMIVDPEDEFFPQEITQIQSAVQNGLNLIVIADWYNENLLEHMKFEAPDSKQKLCYPDTGGANIPALNDLLLPFGFILGNQVLEGNAKLFDQHVKIASGAQIKVTPSPAWISTASLNDIVPETLNHTKTLIESAAIFGLNWPSNSSGFIAIFGDSNCFETNECGSILLNILDFNQNSFDSTKLGLKKTTLEKSQGDLPSRITKSNFASISRVVAKIYKSYVTYKQMPYCPTKTLIEDIASNVKLNISFDNSIEVNELRQRVREYFNISKSIQPNILNDPVYSDYQDIYSDEETRAKSIMQSYTKRFLYLILSFLLISFLWFTVIPRHRFKMLIFKPLSKLLRVFL